MVSTTTPKFGVRFPTRKERTVKRVTKWETREIQKRKFTKKNAFYSIKNNKFFCLFKVLSHQNLLVFVHHLNLKRLKKRHHQRHFVSHQNLLVYRLLVVMNDKHHQPHKQQYRHQNQINQHHHHFLKHVYYKLLI